MLPKYNKSDLTTMGKIFMGIPFMFRYFEEDRYIGDDPSIKSHHYICKGYRFRLIHPVTLVLLPFMLISYFAVGIYYEGLKETIASMRKEIIDLFCIV